MAMPALLNCSQTGCCIYNCFTIVTLCLCWKYAEEGLIDHQDGVSCQAKSMVSAASLSRAVNLKVGSQGNTLERFFRCAIHYINSIPCYCNTILLRIMQKVQEAGCYLSLLQIYRYFENCLKENKHPV
jgi:hypothetical protein